MRTSVQSKIHFNQHQITYRTGIVICVCRKRTSNYENTMSGRSNRNISILAGVRSLRKYRNVGGPFRMNLISACCGRGTITGITVGGRRHAGEDRTPSLRSYVAFLMETFRKTLLLHFQKITLWECSSFSISDKPSSV